MSKTSMNLVDHYHFLLDQLTKTERDMRKFLNGNSFAPRKCANEVDKYRRYVTQKVEYYFADHKAKLEALIEAEKAVGAMKNDA